MEKVVYFLGAGFSAPLGLPVMGNFLEKSKDLYFSNRSTYKHFESVLETIQRLSVSKSYYYTDLFNIEEVLSIIEMNSHLGGDDSADDILSYISTVIQHFTPSQIKFDLGENLNAHSSRVESVAKYRNYALFVASLFSGVIEKHSGESDYWTIDRNGKTAMAYSVVSLNYDLVLESICRSINLCLNPNTDFYFEQGSESDDSRPHLAKLHGSVDSDILIPPTWNKGLGQEDLTPSWQLAYRLLSEANHIRIIGYSLPISDSYIKYLLRAAVIETDHLKSIDVLCLDNTGTVKHRYDDFVSFPNYRFMSGNVSDYLTSNADLIVQGEDGKASELDVNRCNKLEMAHDHFFEN